MQPLPLIADPMDLDIQRLHKHVTCAELRELSRIRRLPAPSQSPVVGELRRRIANLEKEAAAQKKDIGEVHVAMQEANSRYCRLSRELKKMKDRRKKLYNSKLARVRLAGKDLILQPYWAPMRRHGLSTSSQLPYRPYRTVSFVGHYFHRLG